MVLVSGNSMHPTYESGDLIIAWTQDDYKLGDIIVYHPDDLPCSRCNIVHRIVDQNELDGGWITKGDNNDFLDPWQPQNSEIIGEVAAHYQIGWFSKIILNKFLWITILLFALSVFFTLWAWEHLRQHEEGEEESGDEPQPDNVNTDPNVDGTSSDTVT